MVLGLLSSCAVVPIEEEDFYTDKGANGAVETHFFSTDITDIGKAAWDSMREGMVCMSAQALSDIKGAIEQLCTKTVCDEQLVQTLRDAYARTHDAQLSILLTKAQMR